MNFMKMNENRFLYSRSHLYQYTLHQVTAQDLPIERISECDARRGRHAFRIEPFDRGFRLFLAVDVTVLTVEQRNKCGVEPNIGSDQTRRHRGGKVEGSENDIRLSLWVVAANKLMKIIFRQRAQHVNNA